MVSIIVAYTCFTVVFYICFDVKPTPPISDMEDAFEYIYVADLIFSFLQEYKDTETQQPVRSLKKIAK